jgi:hypothetical protein
MHDSAQLLAPSWIFSELPADLLQQRAVVFAFSTYRVVNLTRQSHHTSRNR